MLQFDSSNPPNVICKYVRLDFLCKRTYCVCLSIYLYMSRKRQWIFESFTYEWCKKKYIPEYLRYGLSSEKKRKNIRPICMWVCFGDIYFFSRRKKRKKGNILWLKGVEERETRELFYFNHIFTIYDIFRFLVWNL